MGFWDRKKNKHVITAASVQGLGKRIDQQDSFWFAGAQPSETGVMTAKVQRQDDFAAVIADGMGGLKNGAVISQIIVREMYQEFFAPDRENDPVAFLQKMLWQANAQTNIFQEQSAEKGGSTIVAVYIRQNMLYYLSVGDSRIYLLHNGQLQKINLEHNFGVELDALAAQRIISEQEADNNTRRAALTSYVGMEEIRKIDGNHEPILLSAEDRIVLMSDGIFGSVSDATIKKSIAGKQPEEAVRTLGNAVEQVMKPKQDNYTAVVIRM